VQNGSRGPLYRDTGVKREACNEVVGQKTWQALGEKKGESTCMGVPKHLGGWGSGFKGTRTGKLTTRRGMGGQKDSGKADFNLLKEEVQGER